MRAAANTNGREGERDRKTEANRSAPGVGGHHKHCSITSNTGYWDRPVAILVWAPVFIGVELPLNRTATGTAVYAIGKNDAVTFLGGVRARRTMIIAFCLCGTAAGLGGIPLAGYATKAYQGMGEAFLLPSVATVVSGRSSASCRMMLQVYGRRENVTQEGRQQGGPSC